MKTTMRFLAVVACIGAMSGLVGCDKVFRSEQKTANVCINNMKQLQTAAECWVMKQNDPTKTPKISDLCGPDKYLSEPLKCSKDGSDYTISRNEDGIILVTCGSGDPTHVLQ